jgi:hypothetical protein
MGKTIFTLILFVCIVITSSAKEKIKIEVPLRFDQYYSYEEVNTALKALNKTYPELTKLEVIGKSDEGRDIYGLTINNPKTGEELNKPGVYIDGNIHGNEIQAGEVCLYYANMLLTKYGENEKITKVVDKNTHYIIPVVNVDGRSHFFEDGNTPSSNRSIRIAKDDDNDGLFDEDSSDDLDGDGNICMMRIKDPFGNMKTDPEDPRLMVRVKPGEKGEWTILGYEGIDNDGDGRINEDAEGYLDPNRNWGYNWMPDYVQRGAGKFPLSGQGLKAVAEYINARPNIIVGFAFHNTGGMWLRPPSSKTEKMDRKDIAVFDVLGKNAEKITPGYVYKPGHELYPTHGDFHSHLFNLHGAYSFVGELFMRSQETYRKDITKPTPSLSNPGETAGFGRRGSPEISREQLKFNDNLGIGELYKDWVPYKHPLYGDIEIGGWVKMSSRLPHPFMLPELAHRNAAAVLFSAENTPEVKMEVIDKKKVGKNLYQVTVQLSNNKAMPSMSYLAARNKLYPKDILKVTGAKVIAGGELTDKYQNTVSFKEYKPEVQFLIVPSYGKVDYQFLIEGKGEIKIDYISRKATNLSSVIKLK